MEPTVALVERGAATATAAASSGSLASGEDQYRRCCGAAWRERWRDRQVDLCEPSPYLAPGEASSLRCWESDTGGPLVADDDSATGAWFCEARQLALNSTAVKLGSADDISVPTASQKGLWQPRSLLLRCRLRQERLRRTKHFKMLLRHVLPNALAELPEALATPSDDPAPGATTTVFVARYSVKNFFLAHFDLLQVVAILMQLGDDFERRAQLVFVPPDKANHGWWGPQRALWGSLTTAPPLSYVEWLKLQPSRPLVRVPHAVFALSGFHSVYGRGPVGHAFEDACRSCDVGGPTSAVRPFYRAFLSLSLGRLGQLQLPSADTSAPPRLRAVWISRGKGHGGAYGSKVGRRCLNEPALLNAVEHREPAVQMRAVELADLPFAQQLTLFRGGAILTGMHGAGYANLIFFPPGAVVAELCPLGYCTDSYRRISPQLGLTYMRWTNTIQANAKSNYDTIVDESQFLALMRDAVGAWRAPGTAAK